MTRCLQACIVLAAAITLGACGRESPTAVGAPLLPGGAIHSFELVLDAPEFLESDTTLSGFVFRYAAPFKVVAQDFGGTVTSHALARFVSVNHTIFVRDTVSSVQVTDTAATFFGGRVVLYTDTTADNGSAPVRFQLYRTAQHWDPVSASWTMSVDSGSTHIAWTQPGGTLGALLDTATWTPGEDSVVLHVDSSTVEAWLDTLDVSRGALITAQTPGSRFRMTAIGYTIQAHSSLQRDTVVEITPGNLGSTFVDTPQPTAPPGQLLIGGVPAWRSFLTFDSTLWTRHFSCPPAAGVACTFTLKDVTVNYAALLLQPAPAGVPVPEDSVRPSAWLADTSPLTPLSRTAIGSALGTISPALTPAAFLGDTTGTTVAVPVTSFIMSVAGDTTIVGSSPGVSRTVALVQYPEPSLFGIAPFYGLNAGTRAPRLRLIVTFVSEAQLP